jgi:hypothetical protein
MSGHRPSGSPPPLTLFLSGNVTPGTLALCLGYAVYFGNIVLLLWRQSRSSSATT